MTGKQDPAAAAKASPVPFRACPDCDARLKPADAKCWLCGRELALAAEVVEPSANSRFAALPAPFSPGWSPRAGQVGQVQFSLESLFLVTTLVAVCLGALVAAPPLGVLAILVATPALIRTLVEGHYARQAGTPLTLSEKILAFLASTGVTLAAFIAAFGAFFAACTGSLVGLGIISQTNSGSFNGGLSNAVIWGCIALTLIVTFTTFAGMLWLMRPRKQL